MVSFLDRVFVETCSELRLSAEAGHEGRNPTDECDEESADNQRQESDS